LFGDGRKGILERGKKVNPPTEELMPGTALLYACITRRKKKRKSEQASQFLVSGMI